MINEQKTFYGILSSESEKKLPPLAYAADTIKHLDRRMVRKYINTAVAGIKTVTDVHEQPWGPQETDLGSILRQLQIAQFLHETTELPGLEKRFGTLWNFEDHETRTVIFSAESGMMKISEFRDALEGFRSRNLGAYSNMNGIYRSWMTQNNLHLPELVLPDLDSLRKFDKNAIVDTASIHAARIRTYAMAKVWSPAVLVPRQAAEEALSRRNNGEPKILVADVLKEHIDSGTLPGKNIEFDRTDPHYWITGGKLPRASTLFIGFYAVISAALDKKLI